MHELGSSRRSRLSAGTGKIALALGLCLCAGQLVATPAVASPSTAALVAGPVTTTITTEAAAVKPRITIAANKRTVGYGSKVKLTAKLIDPRTRKALTGGKVRFQAYRKGAWRTWSTTKVSSSGTASHSHEPHITGSFRALFTGSTGYRTVSSSKIRIAVRASGARIIAEASKHRGARYVFGASGPRRFDCSGFTMYVYRKAAGRKLPHKANLQQRHGRAISKSKARPGDLVVFRSGSYGTHVGIYAGGGKMWASPRSGKRVNKQKIYSRNYVVRRLV